MKKLVETYIQDTRIVRKAISGEQCDRLRDEFSEMIASVPSEALDENILFIPVDSFQKYSECIRFNWRGSIQDVLICDTYLMHLCGYLDTMYLSEKEVESDVQKLINKMLAEECMMCKRILLRFILLWGIVRMGRILLKMKYWMKVKYCQKWSSCRNGILWLMRLDTGCFTKIHIRIQKPRRR